MGNCISITMKYAKHITVLVFIIIIGSLVATLTGIFSSNGSGLYTYESIRGEKVEIYGTGIYRHMSAEVAPQGIAQDYVTLLMGIPLLILSLFWARSGSIKGRYLLAGTLAYFLVTYLFYLMMALYNSLFLVYTGLLGTSFFALALTLLSFDLDAIPDLFSSKTPTKWTGGFLIFNSLAIGLLWLSIILPPLIKGTIIPPETEHYTTLVVQGLDLGLLLPLGFVSGLLFIKKRAFGYLLAPVYFVFLLLIMTALLAKIIAMASLGYNVIPAVFIIPIFGIISLLCTIAIFKNMKGIIPERSLIN